MATMNIINVTITSQNVVDVKISMHMHLFYRGFLDYPYYTQLSRKRKCSIVNISCGQASLAFLSSTVQSYLYQLESIDSSDFIVFLYSFGETPSSFLNTLLKYFSS
ncbi:MAG: hypothetical protein K0R67_2888 [Paenibacillus sp.]|nr:hypothetical protein [Paenibacillus sp.]